VPCDKDESSRRALVLAGQNTANEVLMPAARSFYRGELPQNGRLMQTGHDSYALSVVSEVLELRGEGVVTGAAQASGHLALVQAARLILSGEADVVLVLGAPTRLSALEVAGYQMLGALAPVHTRERADQNYFVLDRRSSGFVPLETAAAVVLESASHAALRGATVLAQMTGWRCAMHASSQPAPDAQAAFLVMQAALKAAQLDPAAPGFISAHATGTCAGDAAEAQAIARLFGPAVWVNAPKSILGHGMTAAGVLETVAGILQMRSGFLHACARLAEPLCAGLRHVPAGGVCTAVRSFVNNGFGFGGFNASIVFQSAAAGSAS
jgi:malonyl-ACP decarboxylase